MSRHYHLLENTPGHPPAVLDDPVTTDPVLALDLLADRVEDWMHTFPGHPAGGDAEAVARRHRTAGRTLTAEHREDIHRLETTPGFAAPIGDRVFGITPCTRPGCLDGLEDA